MEINVCLQFVRDVISRLSRSSSSTGPRQQESPIYSQSAPANGAGSSSILRTTQERQCLLQIKRDPTKETADALFGDMVYNGKWICFTMERKAVAIPAGVYKGRERDSQHFGMKVVGISVPNRTDIECHPANQPCQLDGCIATGESIDGDALDNSRAAFDEMMLAVPPVFIVSVE